MASSTASETKCEDGVCLISVPEEARAALGSNDEGMEDSVSSYLSAVVLGLFALLALQLLVMLRQEKERYLRRAQKQGTFWAYIKYRFGHWYGWTAGSASIVLFVLSLSLLLGGGLLLRLLTDKSVASALWSVWCWIAAPDGGGSADTTFGRVVGVFVSCGGMLIFALLMSMVSSSFEGMLHNIREGVSPVIEGDHVIILGWSSVVLTMLAELCSAAESRGGTVIALMTPLPKPEVEELLQSSDLDMKNSTVVVRRGQPHLPDDLRRVGVEAASKVVILSPSGFSREEADAKTLNVLAALYTMGWPRKGTCIVQAELRRNRNLFRSLLSADSEVLALGDFVGKLLVQSCHQRGLANVVSCFFSFEGDELYICKVEGTKGKTFMDLVLGLRGVVVVGLKEPGCDPQLLPPMGRVLTGEEEIVMLAEDRSVLPEVVDSAAAERIVKNLAKVERAKDVDGHVEEADIQQPKIVIIFGWNEAIGSVLDTLDRSSPAGSKVILFAPKAVEARESCLEMAQTRLRYRYRHISVEHQCSPLGARIRLESLPLKDASEIIILSDDSCSSEMDADAQTVALVLQVQDIIHLQSAQLGESEADAKVAAVIVPETATDAAQAAIHRLGLHDVINLNRLSGQILAMVSETPALGAIFNDIVSENGCHIHIRALSEYPTASMYAAEAMTHGISFDEISMIAALAGEVALGWSSVDAEHSDSNDLFEMNPKDRDARRRWLPESRIVSFHRMGGFTEAETRKSPFRPLHFASF